MAQLLLVPLRQLLERELQCTHGAPVLRTIPPAGQWQLLALELAMELDLVPRQQTAMATTEPITNTVATAQQVATAPRRCAGPTAPLLLIHLCRARQPLRRLNRLTSLDACKTLLRACSAIKTTRQWTHTASPAPPSAKRERLPPWPPPRTLMARAASQARSRLTHKLLSRSTLRPTEGPFSAASHQCEGLTRVALRASRRLLQNSQST